MVWCLRTQVELTKMGAIPTTKLVIDTAIKVASKLEPKRPFKSLESIY